MTPRTRQDLYLGGLSGLACSAVIWTWAAVPPAWSSDALLLLCLGVAFAAAAARLPVLGRLEATYPVALAALLLLGAGGSAISAMLAAAANPPGRHGSSRALLRRVALAGLAASVAAWTFVSCGGEPRPHIPWPGSLLPLAAHVAAWAGLRWAQHRLWLRAVFGRRVRAGAAVPFVRTVGQGTLGIASGLALALSWSRPDLQVIPLAAGLLLTLRRPSGRSTRSSRKRQFTASRPEVASARATGAAANVVPFRLPRADAES